MDPLKNFWDKHPVSVIGTVFILGFGAGLTTMKFYYDPLLELKNTQIDQLNKDNLRLRTEVEACNLKNDSAVALLNVYRNQSKKKQVLEPIVLASGESVDMLEGNLTLTAKRVWIDSLNKFEKEADLSLSSVEVSERDKYDFLKYFESVTAGQKYFFEYRNRSYILNVLGIGDFDGKKGVKISVYLK